MSKKTKKQKIEAQKRRSLKILIPPSPVTVDARKETTTNSKVQSRPSEKNIATRSTNEDGIIQKYFLQDLRKSLLVIGFIFVLEFFLYFVTMMR